MELPTVADGEACMSYLSARSLPPPLPGLLEGPGSAGRPALQCRPWPTLALKPADVSGRSPFRDDFRLRTPTTVRLPGIRAESGGPGMPLGADMSGSRE